MPNYNTINRRAQALRRLVGGGIANPPVSVEVEQLDATNSATLVGSTDTAHKKEGQRRSAIDGIGNILLLGMTVLISEIIDLTAARSLEYLLEPCTAKEPITPEEEALADEAGIINVGIEAGEFIPISFE